MASEPRRKNRSAALLEDIRSEVQKVAEGHGTIVRGQQELRAEVARLNMRIGRVEDAVIQGFKNVRASVDALTTRFDTHENTHISNASG